MSEDRYCSFEGCVAPPSIVLVNTATKQPLAYACSGPHLAPTMAETKELGAERLVITVDEYDEGVRD